MASERTGFNRGVAPRALSLSIGVVALSLSWLMIDFQPELLWLSCH